MPLRLCLVIHALHGGGAEKTLARMANVWVTAGHQVTLVTLDSADRDAFSLDVSIDRVCVDGMQESNHVLQALGNNFRRLSRLRRAISAARADAVISFTDQINVLTLLALFGLRRRVIICERADPRHHAMGRSWSLLRRLTYPWCDTLVVQTDGVRDYFSRFVSHQKICVVPNEVQPLADDDAEKVPRVPWIVAVGRLERQKGFDLLIEAFSSIAPKHPDWRLKILGDGALRQLHEDQAIQLGIGESIEFCGWVPNPDWWLRRASLFVLSSRYEGFPNVLLEAMAAGVAVISFDCESGPADIIRHEIDGLLVPPQNVDALAAAIERLIVDEEEREAFAGRAVEVTERFSHERYFARWDAILSTHCLQYADAPKV